jgi:hypothetical protein
MDALTPPSGYNTWAKGTAEYRAKNRATAEVIPIKPERDSRISKSAKSHGDLPFMLGGAAAPREHPPCNSDRSALLTRKIRVGHECVRLEIAIVFGGE